MRESRPKEGGGQLEAKVKEGSARNRRENMLVFHSCRGEDFAVTGV